MNGKKCFTQSVSLRSLKSRKNQTSNLLSIIYRQSLKLFVLLQSVSLHFKQHAYLQAITIKKCFRCFKVFHYL
ncbi:hypothetical protein ABIB50_001867 [Mucilaginibacter sp. UYCu711]